MAILIRNLSLPLECDTEQLLAAAAKKLRVPRAAIRTHAVVRRSLDARKSRPLCYVYHVEVGLDETVRQERRRVFRLRRDDVKFITPATPPVAQPGDQPLRERPVVIGFGPAGMFAALRLAERGYRPIVLERGRDVRRRHADVLKTFIREGVFNPESNYLFGEGGAGAYSDGKLYTRVSDPLVRTVLETFYLHGADPAILVDAHPHIGSDVLPSVCRRVRERIERLGGEVSFDQRVADVVVDDARLVSVVVGGVRLRVGPTVLAVGLSARDTLRMLASRGVVMEAKPFQVGVRVEHPQALVDRWQYGEHVGHRCLPPAEYRLVAKGASGACGDLFTFCMCPGGTILPTNESANMVATNGASRSGRSGAFANAGLVMTVQPSGAADDPLAGLAYLEELERRAFDMGGGGYRAPAQRAADFLVGRASSGAYEGSYPFGVGWMALAELLPAEVVGGLGNGLRMLHARMPGFAGDEAVLVAPETRASAPVRIVRDCTTREAVATGGLYPAGDGAGYAGGIVSAAVDGLKSADAIISRYAVGSWG